MTRAGTTKIKAGRPITARDVMSRPVEFVYIDDTIEHVAALFVRRGIGAAPVIGRDGRLAGIVTKSDLMRYESRRHRVLPPIGRMADMVHPGFVLDPGAETIQDWIVHPVETVSPDAPVSEVTKLMERHHHHHVLVEGAASGRIIGIVSAFDLARASTTRRFRRAKPA